MTLILNGTDNSATTPAVTGTDTDTGVYYPAANQVALATNGTLGLIQDANQNIGLGITPNANWNTFEVIESGRSGNAFFGQTGASQVGLGTNAYYSSGWKYANTAVASLYYQLSGSHTFAGAASGTATNAVTFTTLLAFSRGNTLALEGASQQAGTGITFPATQSASSNANTLDDYEEGTFNPTFIFAVSGTESFSYSRQTGNYIKIGTLVFLCANIIATVTKGTASGDLKISNLPFTNGSSLDVQVGAAYSTGFGTLPTGVLMQGSTNHLYISKNTSTGTIGAADLASSVTVEIRSTIMYYTA